MSDRRKRWTPEREFELERICSELADSKPNRGRKAQDEMDAEHWWQLVARRLHAATGLQTTGEACARRVRALKARREFASIPIIDESSAAEIRKATQSIAQNAKRLAELLGDN